MDINAVYTALEQEFRPHECTDVFPKIGIQYDFCKDVKKVYTATFASDEVFEFLKDKTDCLLFTHHPVPQRDDILSPPPPIKDKWIEMMEKNRISLFSYHIPLDRNGKYSPGNNLAKALNAKPYKEFYLQNNVYMGVICNSPYTSTQDVEKALKNALNHDVKLYSFGDPNLIDGKIAIIDRKSVV